MESYGAHCVYVTDSGGRLTMNDVRDRVRAYRDVLDPATEIGIHAHENLSLSVANSVVAVEDGVTRVDASLAGHGAGAGNCPIEAFVAVADLYGLRARLRPVRPPGRRRRPGPPAAGPARSGSTARRSPSATPASTPRFLRHAENAAARYDVDVRDILMECGRRRLVGGQEDMIIDIALDLVSAPTSA